jgi:hypothetical protein
VKNKEMVLLKAVGSTLSHPSAHMNGNENKLPFHDKLSLQGATEGAKNGTQDIPKMLTATPTIQNYR